MDRIKQLCGFLDPCESFADVGCDHGYCTRYMLDNGLCSRAVVSDVSEKCLAKAERLLARYIEQGVLRAVCCDGLDGVGDCEQVLIAGMGGEEIKAILSRGGIPRKFLLQPMKNYRLLREFLLDKGAEITRDTVIESGGKFYVVLKGVAEGIRREYGEAELEYGRELSTPAVRRYLEYELRKREQRAQALPSGSGGKLLQEIEIMNGALNRGT